MNIGIDLGTTYSAAAYFDKSKGEVVILENGLGEMTTPSVTCIENGKVYIGKTAKDMMALGNCNCVAFYKSFMGEDYTLYIDGKEYTAEDISALYLKEFKKDIEESNNIKIDGAVITVPAYFDECRRTATLNAGRRAGFNVLKIINEPTSAIIAYGLTGHGKKTAMVYDLGGGTFDVTIAEIDGTHVRVLTTNGDHKLGGKDWDQVIFDELAQRFNDEFNVDIANMAEDALELQVQCEMIKKRLSTKSEVTAAVRCSGYVGKYKITREEFEEKTEGLLNQTKYLIEICFSDMKKKVSSFGWRDIDEVVLVGGSTRMPQVKKMIVDSFGREPVTKNINIDTIVAAGAAMQAELCTVNTLSLGAASANTYSLGGGQNASKGAALMISGADIEDITAHSLGMLTLNDDETDYINSIILEKDSRIGVAKEKKYELKNDSCEVYVLQGESEQPLDCNLLYKFTVTGLQKGQVNRFTVAFLYNQNGIVEVTAKDNSGRLLTVRQENLTETLEELIARLKAEHEESKNRRIEAMMIVDVSGSMSGEPIAEARRAVSNFVNACDLNSVSVGIARFASRSEILCGLTNRASELNRAINKIDVDGKLSYGTDGKGLFSRCGREFSRNNKNIKIAVVLTDGCWENSTHAIKEAEALKNAGVKIYAVGLGEADYIFLERIASPGCAQMIDLDNLTQAFGEIAGNIAREI